VGSAIGGIPDYVVPGKNGLLFPPENLGECVAAIRAACRHPLFACGAVDPTILAEKRDYLSAARMGQSFWSTYQEVLQLQDQAANSG
jgi:glycosyltransferase involved in cell wall biosynthesis